jgi:hypothetical protein
MFSARAEAVALRSYCRSLQGDQLEAWSDVVERSTYQHHLRLWEDAGGAPDLSELAELRGLGLARRSMVAGRTLWLGGTEYAYSRAASQFNCAATRYFTVYDAVDAAWLLLNGCGVGAKPQVGVLHGYTRPIPELEVVPSERGKDYRGREENLESLEGGVWTIDVGDSAQAWAKALGKMLNPKVRRADRLRLDFSEVRGAGGRLKGYGWICNGYKPLADALCVVHSILNEKAGELLDELDIGDLHNLMGQILSSRRAAEILHMDSWNPRLQEFMRCKERYWEVGKDYRRQSNNSVLYWSKPSRSELASLLELAFANGDPAPINAAASVRKAPWFQYFNPCFVGDTRVWTIHGPRRFDELVGQEVPVLTQSFGQLCYRRMHSIRRTREKAPVFRVIVRKHPRRPAGSFTATGDHRVYLVDGREVQVQDLQPGMRLASVYKRKAGVYKSLMASSGDTDLEHRVVASYAFGQRPSSSDIVHHIDEDGSNNDPSNLEVLTGSEHRLAHPTAYDRALSGMYGRKHSERSKELIRQRATEQHRRRRNHTVIAVEPAGFQDVYDGTVDDTHKFFIETEANGGVLVHNCGEIFLGAFCNLVTNALPRFGRDFSSLCRAVYLIARANYRQTCVDLRDGVLQPVWHQCNEALRLCGVSLTGIEQAAKLTDYQIRRLRCEATHGAYSMADELDMPRPKAVTCLKPEGSGSKIADCTEGLKRPLGRYVFNWIAFSQHDPLVERHAAAGYRVMPHPQDSNNVLVRFPVDNTGVDFGAGGAYNMEPAVEQLDRYLRWNTLWADHNVSFTVDFDREEIPTIAEWLDVNWDRGYIGAAFLRRNDPRLTAKDLGHPYLPQEVRTEEDFREYVSKLRPVDYAGIQGVYDMADEGCASGACPAR